MNDEFKFKVDDEVKIIADNGTRGWFNPSEEDVYGVVKKIKPFGEDDEYLVDVYNYEGVYEKGWFVFNGVDMILRKEEDKLKLVESTGSKSKTYTPLTVQQSGVHYQKRGIQPIEYSLENNLSFPQANVVKYITRHEDKNGIDDLAKSIHYHFFEALRAYGEEGSTELRDKVLKLLGVEDVNAD